MKSFCNFIWLILLSLALLGAHPLVAVPLSGLYTCANGNPGNAFDYGDIGAFFNELEAQGVSGPVTLDVYDDGGPFTATASYALGITPMPVAAPTMSAPTPVTGLSLANPLTIRAAAGEVPVVSGFTVLPNLTGFEAVFFFYQVGYVTVEGLTINNSPGLGIFWWTQTVSAWNVRIARCKFHGLGMGAFNYRGLSAKLNAVVFENNMVWDCLKTQTTGSPGVFYANTPGVEWIVRHNTVVHTGGLVYNTIFQIEGAPLLEFIGNVVYAAGPHQVWVTTGVNPPNPNNFALTCDYNVYFLGPMAEMGLGTPPGTFQDWQAQGMDPHGIVADPLLVNVNPGVENLHLTANSPARDFVPLATVPNDIDGNPRPLGLRRDAGADEYSGVDMRVEYNAAPVANGGALNLGNVAATGAAFNFTIRSIGGLALNLTGLPPVALNLGANCDLATGVTMQPPLTTIPHNGSTVFTVFVKAFAPGPLDLSISIANSDPLKNPYTFTLNANGLPVPPPNLPAVANLAPGSTLAGPQDGPFVIMLNPGTPLGNAAIRLTDPEGDPIMVQAILPPGAPPNGILAPTIPAQGQPLTLAWTGNVAATNAPGTYVWTVQFRDSVNATLVSCTVSIELADLPPTHIPALATGLGTLASPYEAGFSRGDNAAAGVSLATLNDPNVGQTISLGTVTPGAHPGAVAFTFTVANGLLNVSPSTTLTSAEVGQHSYTVQISDGSNNVDVFVRIAVVDVPLTFTTASQLPPGEVGQLYTVTLQTGGAFGARTFTLDSGALPDSLNLNAGTGQIDGVPSRADTFNFTIKAEDSAGASTTRAFQISIAPVPVTPPGTTSEKDSGCVSGNGRTLPVWLLLAALAGLALWRKDRREKAK